MLGRKSLFVIILGASLIVGALAFLLYKSLFSNSTLAIIVAVATAIFICIMAELTILDLAVRMLAQRRLRILRRLKRNTWWENRPFRTKVKVVESTISPVLDPSIEGKHCPNCGSKKVKKRRMKMNGYSSYRCETCNWRGEETLLLAKWERKKEKGENKKASEAEASL